MLKTYGSRGSESGTLIESLYKSNIQTDVLPRPSNGPHFDALMFNQQWTNER
jgi:hypothetical protein